MSKLGWLQPVTHEDHKTISTRELRQNLAEVLNYTARRKEPVILTRNGAEQAAVVPVENALSVEILDQKIGYREIVQKYLSSDNRPDKFWEEVKARIDRISNEERQAVEAALIERQPDKPNDHVNRNPSHSLLGDR